MGKDAARIARRDVPTGRGTIPTVIWERSDAIQSSRNFDVRAQNSTFFFSETVLYSAHPAP
ncbi:hypothetical protein [Bradyrhizobium sp. SZCCHNRI2007]|uniref:hypothetical protein n=1 Tax=Bradyrhizobium sp. SZCCHNRI2007 TaxID=3057281 RepID=UPI0028E2E81B|nr:hypothetical protein [Bradyrhizobium sp. SZCCHNRI2007]